MPERRLHRRYPRQLRVNSKNPQLAFESVTQDICAGGLFIITHHLLPLNSPIDLEISFGEEEPAVCCRGRIAWINTGQVETFPPGFGVEFSEGDEQVMEQLLEDLGF